MLKKKKKIIQCYRPQDLIVLTSISGYQFLHLFFLCDFYSNTVSAHLVQKVYPAWASAVTGKAKKSVSQRVLGGSGFSCQET